ncbi:hypothetical protein BH24CHL7_BH24CHL7_02180 [soil metagenome]
MPGLRRRLTIAVLLVATFAAGWSEPVGAVGRAAFPAQSVGNTGIDVVALQHLLRGEGFDIAADGVFGASTQSAVADFQAAAEMPITGAATSATWERLVPTLQEGSSGEAVTALQKLLNVKRNSDLAVSASFDSATSAAVRTFQGHMGVPATGLVNPRTWRNLVWHYVKPRFSLPGLCNYNGGNPTADWGTGSAAGMLEAAATLFTQRTGSRLAVGDISWEHGGNIPLHATHEVGLDVDIALVRKDRNQCRRPGIGYRAGQYDRAATRQLIRALYEAAPHQVKLMYFNDPVLIAEGLVQRYPRHDDHIHLRYCEVGHRLRIYRCSAPPLDASPPEMLPGMSPTEQDGWGPFLAGGRSGAVAA